MTYRCSDYKQTICWNSVKYNSWLRSGLWVGFGWGDVQWTIRKTELGFQQTIGKVSVGGIPNKVFPRNVLQKQKPVYPQKAYTSVLTASEVHCDPLLLSALQLFVLRSNGMSCNLRQYICKRQQVKKQRRGVRQHLIQNAALWRFTLWRLLLFRTASLI